MTLLQRSSFGFERGKVSVVFIFVRKELFSKRFTFIGGKMKNFREQSVIKSPLSILELECKGLFHFAFLLAKLSLLTSITLKSFRLIRRPKLSRDLPDSFLWFHELVPVSGHILNYYYEVKFWMKLKLDFQ